MANIICLPEIRIPRSGFGDKKGHGGEVINRANQAGRHSTSTWQVEGKRWRRVE